MKKIKNAMCVAVLGLSIAMVAGSSCSSTNNNGGGTNPVAPTVTALNPTFGPVGTSVTITGTGFTSAATVSFNGVAATGFTFGSATSVTAVVPTGATTGVVVVTVGTLSGTGPSFTVTSSGSTKFKTADGDTSSMQVETTSLIGYWPFDGTSNEYFTNSTPQLSGGTASYVTGRIGQAVHFTNGWFTYGNTATAAGSDNTGFSSNDTLQNGFTVSLWEQVDSTDLLSTLFQLNNPNVASWPTLGIQYRRHSDSTIDLDGGLTNVDGTGTHPTYASAFGPGAEKDSSFWALITMVYDTTAGGSLIYYFNGVSVGSASVSGAFPIPESLLLITPNYATIGSCEATGVTPGDNTNAVPTYMSEGISGNIDDIRFFNKTLTATDVSDLYQLGTHGQ